MKTVVVLWCAAFLGFTASCPERCRSCDASNQCQTCKSGFYGSDCQRNCTGCWEDGCDMTSGICFNCPPGFYSELCDKTCPDNCIINRNGQRLCARESGGCSDGCMESFWGDKCTEKCAPSCSVCYKMDGQCLTCKTAWKGTKCETCTGPDCRAHVKCLEKCKVCNNNTRSCMNCSTGWDKQCGFISPAAIQVVFCGPAPAVILVIAGLLFVVSIILIPVTIKLLKNKYTERRIEKGEASDSNVDKRKRKFQIVSSVLIVVAVALIVAAVVTFCTGLLSTPSIILCVLSLILLAGCLLYTTPLWTAFKRLCSGKTKRDGETSPSTTEKTSLMENQVNAIHESALLEDETPKPTSTEKPSRENEECADTTDSLNQQDEEKPLMKNQPNSAHADGRFKIEEENPNNDLPEKRAAKDAVDTTDSANRESLDKTLPELVNLHIESLKRESSTEARGDSAKAQQPTPTPFEAVSPVHKPVSTRTADPKPEPVTTTQPKTELHIQESVPAKEGDPKPSPITSAQPENERPIQESVPAKEGDPKPPSITSTQPEPVTPETILPTQTERNSPEQEHVSPSKPENESLKRESSTEAEGASGKQEPSSPTATQTPAKNKSGLRSLSAEVRNEMRPKRGSSSFVKVLSGAFEGNDDVFDPTSLESLKKRSSKKDDRFQPKAEVKKPEPKPKPSNKKIPKEEKVKRRQQALKVVAWPEQKKNEVNDVLRVDYTSEEEVDENGVTFLLPLRWGSDSFREAKKELDKLYFTVLNPQAARKVKPHPSKEVTPGDTPPSAPKWIRATGERRPHSGFTSGIHYDDVDRYPEPVRVYSTRETDE